MQMLAQAPVGPWPPIPGCPCCGRPWDDPVPFKAVEFPELPAALEAEHDPSPWTLPDSEPEPPTLLVSGVGLDFLLFLRGSSKP